MKRIITIALVLIGSLWLTAMGCHKGDTPTSDTTVSEAAAPADPAPEAASGAVKHEPKAEGKVETGEATVKAEEKKPEKKPEKKAPKFKIEDIKGQKSVNISVPLEEMMSLNESLKASSPSECDVCVQLTTTVIKGATATGSCWAGGIALNAIFAAADVIFIECCDEFLVPIEAMIDAAWAAGCATIGITDLAKHPDKYAKQWCTAGGMCK